MVHASSPFYSGYFGDRPYFLPVLAWTMILLVVLSYVAEMVDVCHHAQLSFLEPFSLLLSNSLSSWEQLNTRDKF
jgi:hypothetical protein